MNELLRALERARARPRSRPFVTVAYARSTDGCLARTRGRPTQLSSPPSLRLTHALRAHHDALAIGVETALADDPQLTTRLYPGPSPLRVVVDTHLRTPASARLVSGDAPGSVVACGVSAPADRERALAAAGAEVVRGSTDAAGVHLAELLDRLGGRGVRSVMVEGGAKVIASFVRERLVDFVCVTICPMELAGPDAVRVSGRDPALLPGPDPLRLEVGDDVVVGGSVGGVSA